MKPILRNSLLSPFVDFLNDDFVNSPLFRTDNLPAVNVREGENGYQLEVVAPGMNRQDFKLTMDDGQLIISGEKESKSEEKKDNYRRKEYSFNSFSRSFTLPENINPDEIKADYQNGVLRIDLKKKTSAAKVAAREIPIG